MLVRVRVSAHERACVRVRVRVRARRCVRGLVRVRLHVPEPANISFAIKGGVSRLLTAHCACHARSGASRLRVWHRDGHCFNSWHLDDDEHIPTSHWKYFA